MLARAIAINSQQMGWMVIWSWEAWESGNKGKRSPHPQRSTGALYFDADGTGSIDQLQIAQLSAQTPLNVSGVVVVS